MKNRPLGPTFLAGLTAALRTELSVLSLRRGVRTARLAYIGAADRRDTAYEELDHAITPQTRALILSDLAAFEQQMATAAPTAWSSRHDTGPTTQAGMIAAGHETAAQLLHLIADTETGGGAELRAEHGPDHWEHAFGHVLDDLAETTAPARRAELTTRLYIAAHPIVGTDAAETIARVGDAYTRCVFHERLACATAAAGITRAATTRAIEGAEQ